MGAEKELIRLMSDLVEQAAKTMTDDQFAAAERKSREITDKVRTDHRRG